MGWGLVPEAPSGRGGWLAWRDRHWRYVGASQELGCVPFARPDGSRDVTRAPTRAHGFVMGKGERVQLPNLERSQKGRTEAVKCFTPSPHLELLHLPNHRRCFISRNTPCQLNMLPWLYHEVFRPAWAFRTASILHMGLQHRASRFISFCRYLV